MRTTHHIVSGLVAVFTVLSAGPLVARADSTPLERVGNELNDLLWDATKLFDKQYANATRITYEGTVGSVKEPGRCAEYIAKAKAAGVSDDALVVGYHITLRHPKVVEVDGVKGVRFKDAGWICDAYELDYNRKLVTVHAISALAKTEEYKKYVPTGSPVGDPPKDDPAHISCEQAAQRAMAKQPDLVIEVNGEKVAVADVEAKYCVPMRAAMLDFYERAAEAAKASEQAVRKKYEDLGVKGDRLKLFIEYDDVHFRGKGCEIITDIKKLVKAKYLYHWLENPDYTHTIRKYTFKGNKYKVSEKTYTTEAKAYKGCK